jgi:ureidoglycolate hydrolase
MNDATWLDSRKKWYGMLISADNETFVGKDGNKDEAIRIDVFVEEGEQFVNFNKN